ncbi:MAG: Fic family protein [Gammaproteobacteria bacterium]|nr:Fic family protein [Gammaproteobacteria bacterium]
MCLDSFEKFLHDELVQIPVLVKAALAHLQFETIHPFLDGNGRLGRLLITLILCVEGILREPLLYLSLYLKTHRDQYYELLQSVRETGNWEDWIEFFLEGVIETSEQATETAQSIIKLFKEDRNTIENSNRSTSSALAIHVLMQHRPILTTSQITAETGSSLPTVLRNLAFLEDIDIVKEVTGKQRNKIFTYRAYLEILNQGTEPLSI